MYSNQDLIARLNKGEGTLDDQKHAARNLNADAKNQHFQRPTVGQIIIVGEVGGGKTAILARINKMLQEEFGARVICPELEQEGGDPLDVPDWLARTIRKTTWFLEERS